MKRRRLNIPTIKTIPIRMISDVDRDGVLDYKDCRPFDRKRQDDYFVRKEKVYLYEPDLYAQERWDLPPGTLGKTTLRYARDENEQLGALKEDVDRIGKDYLIEKRKRLEDEYQQYLKTKGER